MQIRFPLFSGARVINLEYEWSRKAMFRPTQDKDSDLIVAAEKRGESAASRVFWYARLRETSDDRDHWVLVSQASHQPLEQRG